MDIPRAAGSESGTNHPQNRYPRAHAECSATPVVQMIEYEHRIPSRDRGSDTHKDVILKSRVGGERAGYAYAVSRRL